MSPGVFYCSTSYLPSAICSNLLLLSISYWLKRKYGITIFLGCVSVLWTGWPFVGVIFLPLGIHMLYDTYFKKRMHGVLDLIVMGILILMFTIVISLAVDSNLYNKWYIMSN